MKRRYEAKDKMGVDDTAAIMLLRGNARIMGDRILSCHDDTIGAKKAERIEALRLLCAYTEETGIIIDGWTSVNYMKALLNLSPEYRLRAFPLFQLNKDKELWTQKCWLGGDKDWSEFTDIYRRCRVSYVTLGFRFGAVIPQMQAPPADGPLNGRTPFMNDSLWQSPSLGVYAGTFVQWHYNSWLVGGIDLGYEQFSISRSNLSPGEGKWAVEGCQVPGQIYRWQMQETSARLNGAFTLRAEIETPTRIYAGSTFGRFSIAPVAGIGVNYLVRSISDDFKGFSSINDSLIPHGSTDSGWTLVYSDNTRYSSLKGRQLWEANLLAGLALKMKFDHIHIDLEWRWNWGRAYLVKPGNLSFEEYFCYGYREYQHTLNRHTLTAGVSWNFYRILPDNDYTRRSFREKCVREKEGAQK